MATPNISFGCSIGHIEPSHLAEFAQRDQSITGRQVERLFHIPWTSDHAD